MLGEVLWVLSILECRLTLILLCDTSGRLGLGVLSLGHGDGCRTCKLIDVVVLCIMSRSCRSSFFARQILLRVDAVATVTERRR